MPRVWGKPLPMNVSMPIAAVLLDLDFPPAILKGDPDPRPHRLAARASRRGERAADRLPDGGGGRGGHRLRSRRTPDARSCSRDAALGGAGGGRRCGLSGADRLSLRAVALLPRRLAGAGFPDAASVGGLDAIAALPLTEKDELRASRTAERPIGAHLAVPMAEVVRIYSTSGTTGAPSYIPLTAARPRRSGSRSPAAPMPPRGCGAGQRLVSTYGAGPFVAGAALDAFAALGLCHIPVGPGNTERLLAAVQALGARRRRADALLCAASGRGGGRARHRPRRLERGAAPRRRRARGRGAGAARAARGGLGRAGHRGDGDRRHRGLALGRVRGAGGDAFLRPRLRPCRADRPGDRRAARPARTGRRGSSSIPTSATAPRRCCASAAATTCGCGRPLRLRAHQPAGALHRAHRRHADRARGQPLPDARCARWWRASRRR